LDQAIAALNAGDLEEAEKLAELALQAEPNDTKTRYVARVVARERELKQAGNGANAGR
jgi:Flp pilus assembly protein TadD